MSEAVHIQAVHQAPLAVHQGRCSAHGEVTTSPPLGLPLRPVATGGRGGRFNNLPPSGIALGWVSDRQGHAVSISSSAAAPSGIPPVEP